ncbi:phosphatase PAP2 family protein [Streptomyces sp. H10-C2]|uniref:bifunctional phosphatase PAP2/diacylglycerol kinase family protein n=1 Tax=unclassified Streptomyces TaxID=2593676 RepID=UPI0024B966AA|nr:MULTISPECIES: bifunctional phosphatase PAP2/diacylglycerol kinase family protein [unclassified Streptomyces]MDJ0344338.1 phosphatase PAP2 family protein [Streptomyces sp. PH10-H1]MDJ0373707.1 phosphatase PAP2 family protein [Streptomyces sp. H10-C2]
MNQRGRAHPWKAWDHQLFHQVASRQWPGADPALPALSRSANHGLLWFGVAAGIAAAGGKPGRRAALRGIGSLALASATVNTVGKRAVRRARPILEAVPVIRRLRHQPFTTSFPSGHAASAAAFAAGVAMESGRWGAVVAPVAASVAFSRVYTGVHYPSDVLAGAALGVGAAIVVRALLPTTDGRPADVGPAVNAPALPAGHGLFTVVNEASGPPALLNPPAERIRTALPMAGVTECTEDDDLAELLEKAARQAVERGGALGVCGGDGTVNVAASIALRHGLPLVVFPGGTRNHFALDLGIESVEDAAGAVVAGSAAAVDLATYTSYDTPGDTPGDREAVPFVNTFSIGSYPELVRIRERWARRVGSWPASVLAAVHVLRTSEPVDVEINGRHRSVWLVFAGNCEYSSVGLAPVRRRDLNDGILDVRVVDGGPFARTRLLGAALTGVLTHSPVYAAAKVRRLRIRGLGAGTHLAYDGEVVAAPSELQLGKLPGALVVYRP